ncbi:MAG: hypothetical protein AVDCRST_MAG89-1157 [uncultured Gemmatimonadetes bacterium]|uniref:6-bladed beta-propeller n=1 Tax=uncultured Gemmatimonadota bacterium TaxID=203437 RepID=A0A6J4KQU3_9BACT|nr:MAG: hypothetical protein AVDCRST_MAG89-1157 [uncultured Gemmatimonadota bacterium]
MDVDSYGRILVADGGQVLVLSPQGRVERRIGRPGSGPGEFRYVATVAALARDSLFVFDPGLRRISVYAPGADKPAYSTHLSSGQTTLPYWARPAGKRGQMVAVFNTARGDVPERQNGTAPAEVLRLLNPDGSVARDSLVLMPEVQMLDINNTEGRGVFHYPFARSSAFALTRRGVIYHAWTDSLRFTAYGLDGRRLREFRAPHVPRPVSNAEIDSVVQRLAKPPFSEATIRRALREAGTRTWPAFRGFFVDDQERLWVALTPASDDADLEWLVLGPSGQRLGSLRLPQSVTLGAVRGNRAYAVARDENDVESIVVYQLTSTPGATAAKAGQ